MKKVILKTCNVYCNECAEHLELEMLKKEYIKSARVDMKHHLLFLGIKKGINKNKLENEIVKKGFKAEVISIK